MVYPGLEPRKTIGKTTVRKVLHMGVNLCETELTTHNNSLTNLVRGVGERVLYTDGKYTLPIQPMPGVFVRRLGGYRTSIARLVGRQSPVSRQCFADLYKGPRHAVYQRAVDSLAVKPVGRADARLKTFVKAEKINLRLKADPVPRVIQPRDPRYNVEVGRFLKPVEYRVYEAINDLFGGPTVFSEFNAFQQAKHLRAKWDSFSRPACIGLDASRFDQHVSEQALLFEHGLYRLIFGRCELMSLLGWQVDNVGLARAADGWFKYRKRGGRASGDMNTSLGNKFLMCLMCKFYIDSKPVRIEFVNNGDDCLMLLERAHVPLLDDLAQRFTEFGFKLTLEEPVYEFEQIEFCQTRPVCAGGIWRMVRNVATCFAKDITVVNLGHDELSYRRRLWHIGECGLAVCADVPVLSAFYAMLKRFGERSECYSNFNKYDYYSVAARGARAPSDIVTADSRLSFYIQTAITPDEQLALEDYFANSVWATDKRQLINNNTLAPLLLRKISHG